MTDDDIWNLRRGGHDPQKVFAAFDRAVKHEGQPTVLLVKTVKGYGMGKAGEAKNTVHQTKKLTDDDIRYMRDRFNIPIPDSELPKIPFYKAGRRHPRDGYLHERRRLSAATCRTAAPRPTRVHRAGAGELWGRARADRRGPRDLDHPGLCALLTQLLRDQAIGPRVVPILVDEAHLRHGRPVPPDRHLQPAGPAVHPGRPRPGHVLPRRTRPARSCRKASTRPAA